ncbi:uncharacterized protein LOC116177194 [Photinus pyralis]|uniref:uncharacterized protein LOC116177194 n=1 Tax=Photinus pyralis TaxID=7054 RepID=UPI001267426A|nr:uncharacterized protein LOC116177194 [Photinus pyralis]
MGNSVVTYYQTQKQLDNKRRTRLVDIIIKYLYTYIIRNRLRHEEYNKITAKIITLFPTETMGIYYVPAVRKNASLTGKPTPARGKLVDKVKNMVFNFDEATPKRRKRKHVDTSDNEASTSNAAQLSLKFKQELSNNEDWQWMKHNNEPWTEVLIRWDNTYNLRHDTLNKCSNVYEFLENWTILQDQRADVLINQDFKKAFPGKEINLFTKWKTFFETVNQVKGRPNEDLIELANEDTDDIIFLKQLLKLPHLIPPKGRMVTKSHKHWKYSTLEVIDAIVVLAKIPGDITKVVEERRQLAASRNLTLTLFC